MRIRRVTKNRPLRVVCACLALAGAVSPGLRAECPPAVSWTGEDIPSKVASPADLGDLLLFLQSWGTSSP